MRGITRWGLALVVVVVLVALGRAPAGADAPGEFDAWTAIQQTPTDAAIVAFLTHYPESPFRDKAASMLADLRGTSPADVLDQYGASQAPQSTTSAPTTAAPTPPGPTPASKPEPPLPVGTYARSGQKYYDDQTGFYAWEETLVLNADGTADLTVKHTDSYRPFYWLRGCGSESRVGRYRWERKYTVASDAATLTLQPQGPATVSWIDPYCWKPGAGTGGDKPWVLNWVDGRLSDDDGAYVRKY